MGSAFLPALRRMHEHGCGKGPRPASKTVSKTGEGLAEWLGARSVGVRPI